MTNDEKITYYLRDMRQKGVRSWTAAPPAYRLLWRLGIKVRPLPFASFWSIFWALAVPYTIYWAIFFLIMWWWNGRYSVTGLVASGVGAACGAAITAAIIAADCRRRARELALPPWEVYPNP